jgi:hypothetical protein
MLLRAILILPLLSLPLAAIEVGETLPPLKGEFLTGRVAVLPAAAQGKPALLALGFTYKSRFAVEEWVKNFRAAFDNEPRVTFFEVPMLGGMATMGKWFIDSGMRRGTPKADHEHVITVYGGASDWKKKADFQAPDAAYLFLIDKNGKVVWKHIGPFAQAPFAELSAKLKAVLP